MTESPAPVANWDGAALDLPAYLARIGFTGEPAPTLDTLRALQYAHTTTIPFENIEPVLKRPVLLDLPSLQDKIVRSRRGGYCYENVGLFAAALERIGFGVTGLHGRVSMGARGEIRPATHALLRVTTADDGGCGCATSVSVPGRWPRWNCIPTRGRCAPVTGDSGWNARAANSIRSCGCCTTSPATAGSTATASP
ncbi:Arylamine N-acetyltransferase [Nocardia africana]|uniref:Arylamine N-acetyltransferase n=1 Tax=Nocardia africana TaxID=134964 RepID=A0A378WPG5_9NOCA|nr:Arylamine N-acetyltransferase [Nocardia africana]